MNFAVSANEIASLEAIFMNYSGHQYKGLLEQQKLFSLDEIPRTDLVDINA